MSTGNESMIGYAKYPPESLNIRRSTTASVREMRKMSSNEFLIKLVYDSDPMETILGYLVEKLSDSLDLGNIGSSYERLEDELSRFEEWLHEVWGVSFYHSLVGETEERALSKAYRIAGERDANVLIADGFSIRELLVLMKALPGRVTYSAVRAVYPTTTSTAARSFFGTKSLEDAFHGSRLIDGREWWGKVISDVRDPPKIGSQKHLSMLTYYPDAPLHNAVKYGIAAIQDISRVIGDLIQLISELALISDLVVTGDHGYIFLGRSPNRYLWRWIGRAERQGGSYGNYGLNLGGEKAAIGRFHAPDVQRSGAFIVHGGVSLTESLVPIITVKGGA